ncbi:MAG TPA: (2Fe-2S)-binding protein [Steroidobacteraceae bacterium]|nr:(2Fe-2S)-binding protein [Steroidobacteraceae bacterium]
MTHTLEINGVERAVNVDGDTPLLWVLRDEVGLKGAKFGCGSGACGACTVLIDGQAARSCMVPVSKVGARRITTVEGLSGTPLGRAVQQAWLDLDVVQCGYCQSGQMLSATALLATHAHPTDGDIDVAMRGNLCRCGTYLRIRAAIKRAAELHRAGAVVGAGGAT